ncbi:hypothetical protein [Microbispora sp. KK1-11]|uniref:hypothetical protein n=1 Tax=Microbispora sp. KK1-11 TaxID=2053005 RepID=UPI001157A271|nr:hypothetical protein [Microbispora sp. KK1-11]TQS31153.1 hypothetical protein FLW16_02475 [Microbispora sp. KK1-11]
MPPSAEQQLDRQARHRLAIIRHAEEVTGNAAASRWRSRRPAKTTSDGWRGRVEAGRRATVQLSRMGGGAGLEQPPVPRCAW